MMTVNKNKSGIQAFFQPFLTKSLPSQSCSKLFLSSCSAILPLFFFLILIGIFSCFWLEHFLFSHLNFFPFHPTIYLECFTFYRLKLTTCHWNFPLLLNLRSFFIIKKKSIMGRRHSVLFCSVFRIFFKVTNQNTPTPWLPRICFTRISLTQLFKRFPFLT